MSDNVIHIDRPVPIELTDKAHELLGADRDVTVGDLLRVGRRVWRVTGYWQERGGLRISALPLGGDGR